MIRTAFLLWSSLQAPAIQQTRLYSKIPLVVIEYKKATLLPQIKKPLLHNLVATFNELETLIALELGLKETVIVSVDDVLRKNPNIDNAALELASLIIERGQFLSQRDPDFLHFSAYNNPREYVEDQWENVFTHNSK